jgi:hypothetical protein
LEGGTTICNYYHETWSYTSLQISRGTHPHRSSLLRPPRQNWSDTRAHLLPPLVQGAPRHPHQLCHSWLQRCERPWQSAWRSPFSATQKILGLKRFCSCHSIFRTPPRSIILSAVKTGKFFPRLFFHLAEGWGPCDVTSLELCVYVGRVFVGAREGGGGVLQQVG